MIKTLDQRLATLVFIDVFVRTGRDRCFLYDLLVLIVKRVIRVGELVQPLGFDAP